MDIFGHNKNVGKKFNKLTVLSVFRKTGNSYYYLCLCECGKTGSGNANKIISGTQVSCGCYRKNKLNNLRFIHGKCNSVEYRSYSHAKERCNNPKCHNYYNYGGRGIKFLFESFEEFYSELGDKPSSKHQLDRIDNDGNYEKGNVRWVTVSENCLNKIRKNVTIKQRCI